MRRVLTLAGVAAIALAACSSDDQPDLATVAPTTTASDTTASDTTVEPSTSASSTSTAASPERTLPPTTTTIPLATGAVTFTKFVDGLTKPVEIATQDYVTYYVAQQDGRVVLLEDGAVGDTVLDLSDEISTDNEQGLLGLAFDPAKKFAYVDYTDRRGDTVIAEYAVNGDGSFDAASARTVLTVDQPYANHNGGKVTFGNDGYLYIGLGDGGAGGDPERRAMNVGSLLGKILRIDPNPSADGQPYTVPADNPFVGVEGARPEIWSVGLRNPWRFAFDPSTDDLWIADVGQNQWEEVDFVSGASGSGRGANFGWSAWEGTHRFNDDQPADGVIMPIHEYPHGDDGCSVSGGEVYHGSAVSSLARWYVFADYCSGRVWALQPDGTIVSLGTVPGSPSAVVSGPGGELYVLAHGDGVVFRIDPA